MTDPTLDDEYENECAIIHSNAASLRFSAYPDPVTYIRAVSSTGEEIAYWTIDEILEDPSDVLGAAFGAVLGGKII